MAGLVHYFAVVENASEAGVASATGFVFSSLLFTASDAAPRTATHKYIGTPFNGAQESAIETPVTGARAVFPWPNAYFEQYNRKTEGHIPALRLLELGLTTNPN